ASLKDGRHPRSKCSCLGTLGLTLSADRLPYECRSSRSSRRAMAEPYGPDLEALISLEQVDHLQVVSLYA
ncbi:hypothetical protein NKJ90_32590, partial [Mesorhizobium sp. M0051]|uniref:hypothetical protein n=1 Tax=Mesorhizobium sp. M0051 TaxID=2956862 RepID=UPI003337BE39